MTLDVTLIGASKRALAWAAAILLFQACANRGGGSGDNFQGQSGMGMGPGGGMGYWDSLIPSGPTSTLPGIGEGGGGGGTSLGGDFGGGGLGGTTLDLPAGMESQIGQLLQSAYGQAAALPEGQALAYFLGQLYAQWQRDRENAMAINRILASILIWNQCKQVSTQQVNKDTKIPANQKARKIRKKTIICTVTTLQTIDQRLRALAREMLVPVAQALLQALFGR